MAGDTDGGEAGIASAGDEGVEADVVVVVVGAGLPIGCRFTFSSIVFVE